MMTCGILQKVGGKINEFRSTLCNNFHSCAELLGARLGITIMSILTVSRSTFINRPVSGGVAPNTAGRYINVNLSVKDNKKVFLAIESLSPLS